MSDKSIRSIVASVQSRIATVSGVFAGMCLLALTLLVTAHVVLRYLTGSGIRGVDEMSSYLMLGLVYGGLAIALRDGTFIQVDVLADRFKGRVEIVVALLVRTLALGFVALLTWRTWQLVLDSHKIGLESIGMLRLDLWIPQAVVAVGCTILGLQVLISVIFPDDSASRDATIPDVTSAAALATPPTVGDEKR